MAENTVKIDIPFQSLAELLDEEDSPEDIAEIEVARADYEAGDYTTFEE